MSESFKKFFLAFGLAAVVLFLQIELSYFLSFRPNLILAFLIAASFFYNLGEILALALFSIFMLNWQPSLSFEILIILVFPVLAFYLRRVFPWQNWLNNLVLIFIGLVIFYLAVNPFVFSFDNLKFQGEIIASLISGSINFAVFRRITA